ncbi:MAG TPA: type II toxin-antitoxin system VapC family toxin [Syntrophaceae bacterium]|nr:type II toxin-antitoxin system VapC family toxin [Syntrophaceae bacterium]
MIRICFFDSNVIIKLYTKEEGHKNVNNLIQRKVSSEPFYHFTISEIIIGEVLNILKCRIKNKKRLRRSISLFMDNLGLFRILKIPEKEGGKFGKFMRDVRLFIKGIHKRVLQTPFCLQSCMPI